MLTTHSTWTACSSSCRLTCASKTGRAPTTTEASGIAEFRRLAEQAKTIFSEREQRITAFKQGADYVTVGIAYRGQLAVDIPDGPRVGTVLELNGESEFAFDGHLISRIVDRS